MVDLTADFCFVSGKVRHATEAEAEARRRHVASGKRGRTPQRVYECKICGGWHLTHRATKGRGNRRRRKNA